MNTSVLFSQHVHDNFVAHLHTLLVEYHQLLEEVELSLNFLPQNDRNHRVILTIEILAAKTQSKLQHIIATPLSEEYFSLRTWNVLNCRKKYKTLGDVAKATEAEFRSYLGVGPKTVNEIKRVLAQFGLSLGMEFTSEMIGM